jgi:hypothetical protein
MALTTCLQERKPFEEMKCRFQSAKEVKEATTTRNEVPVNGLKKYIQQWHGNWKECVIMQHYFTDNGMRNGQLRPNYLEMHDGKWLQCALWQEMWTRVHRSVSVTWLQCLLMYEGSAYAGVLR